MKDAVNKDFIKLELNYRVPSLNSVLYRNRFIAIKLKKEAQLAVINALPRATGNKDFDPGGDLVNVHIHMHRNKLIDQDNCLVKYIVDQLRYSKLLKDDNPLCANIFITQEKCKRTQEKTTITLTR